MMKFVKNTEPKRAYYEELESGTLFRNPESEDIYLKIDDTDKCVHL